MHDDDAVGEAHRLDLVMRHVDRGRALLECRRLISARISSRSLASSAPIGSSISIAFGRRTSARPIATRCMSPPDSADGRLFEQVVDAQRPRSRAPPVDIRGAHARRPQREGDVLEHRHVRVEREGLEHHGDVAVRTFEMLHRLPSIRMSP
jgi:hypothetical protein